MKILRKCCIILLGLLALFTIAGFFVLPPVITSVLTKNLGQALHRDVSIGKVSVNPYTLVIEVQDFSVRDRDRDNALVAFRTLTMDIQWSSLFSRAPVVREVRLYRPSIGIIRYEDNTYNFSDLLQGGKKEREGKPLLFSVSNIQITHGSVTMDDRPVGRVHKAEDITLTIPFISNMPHLAEVFVQPSFRAVVNGTPLELRGRSKPFSESLESSLTMGLKNIDVPYYLDYLPVKPGFSLRSGLIDLDATVTFLQYKDGRRPESNVTGHVVCRELAIKDLKGDPLLAVPSLSIDIAASHLLNKDVHVGKIGISAPEVHAVRDRSGALNLVDAIRKTSSGKTSRPPGEDAGAPPMLLVIDEVDLSEGKITYEDRSGSSPVKIATEDLSIEARDISTEGQGRGALAITCTLNRTGRLSLETSFTLKPVSAEGRLDLQGFQPAWIQPYVMDRIPILVRRGALSTSGSFRFAKMKDKPVQARFTGDIQLAGFASVDSVHAQDLVSLKDLAVRGVDLSLNPVRLNIREIALSRPAAAITVNPDGRSNIASVLGARKGKPEKAPAPDKQKGKTLERISIGRITIRGGQLSLTDRSITPKYATSLDDINGTVSGLTSDEMGKATVNLHARLDRQAPISITGSVNPLKKDLFVDLTASLKNMELSPVTPYSGKYAGYAIDKGKLSLDLRYSIDRKKLDAKNDVLIDQLTFGESVESRDATRLPVRLAVALLRDSSGKIDLHLPVTGRTDDPDFHVGRVILKIIVNLLEKAATSPFALLEALYPGASELSAVEFEPGRASLTESGKGKLAEIARIMQDRPSLNLEVKGFVDADSDRAGLVTTLFERKLKAIKLKDLLRAGKQTSNVDDIVIGPDEYSTCLKKAYKAETFKKPSNFLGIEKTLPDEEMKRLMLEHISVSDDDLKDLAAARSGRVRDELIDELHVDGTRIFLVEADPFKPESLESVIDSRVSLTLR